jgi:hypothetical protein
VVCSFHDELVRDARDLGGRELLLDIHREALAWVDEAHPWDGTGDEPGDRASAYLAVWWQRVDQERAARIGTLVQRADGRWWTVGPARCPRGHPFGPRRVLIGWSPCRCRGHHTWTCQVEMPAGTCGATVRHPEPGPRCREIGIG